jgi:predicted amidohydrolase YtcJ
MSGERGPSRPIAALLTGISVLCVSWAVAIRGDSNPQSTLDKLHAYPELIVVNGRIATMDSTLTNVNAMAVRGGRILALGTNDEIEALAGPATETLDVKGRRVLPGIIDSHTHPQGWAVKHWLQESIGYGRKHDPQLEMTFVKADRTVELVNGAEAAIRRRAKELGPGKWIWIGLWSENNDVAESVIRLGTIDRAFLDRVAPDNPVMLDGPESLGPSLNNTMAKNIMEEVLGREVLGLRALYLVPFDIILRGRVEAIADIVKKEMETCLIPYGITTVVGHIESPETLRAMSWLDRRGEMPVRWGWVHRIGYSLATDPVEFYSLIGDTRGQGSEFFWNIGAGEESWESRDSYSCTEAEPRDPDQKRFRYAPCPADRASIKYDAKGYRALKATVEAGLRPTFLHAYVDGTYDALFRLLDQAVAEKRVTIEQIRDARIGLEHNQVVRPDQIEKIVKYGLYLSFQGYQLQDPDKGLAYLQEYGEKYLKWMMPVRSLMDAGVKVTFNTDVHLTTTTPEGRMLAFPESWDNSVWALYQFFMTRNVEGRVFSREQAVDRLQVIKAATNTGAEYGLRENDLGSLEVGKLADFVVIDKDYFSIPVEEIHTIKNLVTVIGGKVVYRSEKF